MQKFCHNKMQILVVSWKFYNYHGIRAKQSKFLMSNENKPKNLTVYFTTLTKKIYVRMTWLTHPWHLLPILIIDVTNQKSKLATLMTSMTTIHDTNQNHKTFYKKSDINREIWRIFLKTKRKKIVKMSSLSKCVVVVALAKMAFITRTGSGGGEVSWRLFPVLILTAWLLSNLRL